MAKTETGRKRMRLPAAGLISPWLVARKTSWKAKVRRGAAL
jgi:hypothetical protein